jgi:phage tail sheath protein FI
VLYVARVDGDATGGNWAAQNQTPNGNPAAVQNPPPDAAEEADVLGLSGKTLQEQVDKALNRLEPMVSISILAAPGALNKGIQDALVTHAKANQRIAVLDGKHSETVDEASIAVSAKSDYSAVYYPWIQVSDSTGLFDKTGVSYLPPSGLVAGIYARVDTTRGVHKAPANESVAGALGLSYLASANEQKIVNPVGINVIRSFAGSIKVWGARTFKDPADQIQYVNVRRTMIYLARSLELGTQWVVFEPNAHPTWQKVIRSVTAFLTRVWRDGALFGLTAEDAFYVRCDETTNPPENRDVGILTIEVGVAIVRPAEFVVIRISQAAELPTS